MTRLKNTSTQRNTIMYAEISIIYLFCFFGNFVHIVKYPIIYLFVGRAAGGQGAEVFEISPPVDVHKLFVF